MQREQNLAAHSFGVAMLVQQVFPECRKELLLAVLHHDLPEYVTGDIPAPVKRASPAISVALEDLERGTAPLYQDFNLLPSEASVLKWADLMELVLWCLEEVMLGNAYAMKQAKTGLTWLWQGSWIAPPHVLESMHAILSGATQTARRLGIHVDIDTGRHP
jgi:5'-deoxynucleotidase YfbR-like HD superfamily hydrolase